MKHLCDVFSSWVTISRMKEPITLIYKFPRVTCPPEGWVVARPASNHARAWSSLGDSPLHEKGCFTAKQLC